MKDRDFAVDMFVGVILALLAAAGVAVCVGTVGMGPA